MLGLLVLFALVIAACSTAWATPDIQTLDSATVEEALGAQSVDRPTVTLRLQGSTSSSRMSTPISPAPAVSQLSSDTANLLLALPFEVDQHPDSMMPMGETIEHSPPAGHPGIDFQWLFPAEIVVAIEGIVGDITQETNAADGSTIYQIGVISEDYGVTYEVNDLYLANPEIQIGDRVSKGQVLGIPQVVHDDRRMMHWGFGRARPTNGEANPEGVVQNYWVDWLCPIPYLSPNEYERLRDIWTGAYYKHKDQFPELCNGPSKNYE